MPCDMRGLWDEWYAGTTEPFRWGDDDVTYRLAAAWLDPACATVEDWGGGSGWARRFFRSALYSVVDGSAGDRVDLQEYRSNVDGVMLRHVLEHNRDWSLVLANAAVSFRKRMVIVIFTPWTSLTAQIASSGPDIPTISFNKDELLALVRHLFVGEATCTTRTYYGQETVLYFERPASVVE